MTEQNAQGPTVLVGNNKIAMSRALGAAFLNHQVEQLERSTGNTHNTHSGRNGRSDASNWRERPESPNAPRQAGRNTSGGGGGGGGNGGSPPSHVRSRKPDGRQTANPNGNAATARRQGRRSDKEADVVVVDASVLVHCIGQIKTWCRDGREEVIIVPLEVLNTLDLLKKGSSLLAQRARAASRFLEHHVGSNPRIRVQSDSAFVLWDDIPFTPADAAVAATTGATVTHDPPSPEWLRRTVCCARWEATQAHNTGKRVALAVLAPAPTNPRHPQQQQSGTEDPALASPVPLPASSASPGQTNKSEARAQGTLVRAWAARAGVPVLDVRPAPEQAFASDDRAEPAGRRRTSGPSSSSPEGHRQQQQHQQHPHQQPVRRMPSKSQPLVERPPAVKAMMEAVAQPTRVVRVLARGEKLDP